MIKYLLASVALFNSVAFAQEAQPIITEYETFLMPSGDIVCSHGLDSGLSLGCVRYNEQPLVVVFQYEIVNVETKLIPRETFRDAKLFPVGKIKKYADMVCTSKETGLECEGELISIELTSKTFKVSPIEK